MPIILTLIMLTLILLILIMLTLALLLLIVMLPTFQILIILRRTYNIYINHACHVHNQITLVVVLLYNSQTRQLRNFHL